MADDDLDDWGGNVLDYIVNPVEDGTQKYVPPPSVNPLAYSKYPLQRLWQAAYDGDLEFLAILLDRDDPANGYHHDINEHMEGMNPLHAAATNGQLEAVEMLLNAKADPHVKCCVAYGRDPKDGETAREIADRWGWDDVTAVLKNAEERTPKGVYLRYGPKNNSKLWPMDQPEGLCPAQEKRARRKHRGLARPLPTRAERKFYGDFVFGVTHGWDEGGNVIRQRVNFASGIIPGSTPVVAQERDTSTVPSNRLLRVGLLFPGQGSQYFRMMSSLPETEKVRSLLASSRAILGFDIVSVCTEGPEERLDDLVYSQPAIFVASMVAVEKLRQQRPEAVDCAGAVAGLSLGEYAALTVAGVFDFELGLRLIKERSEAMATASAHPRQSMLSVAGIEKGKLRKICADVEQRLGSTVRVACELFGKGCTCSGEALAIKELQTCVDKAGALQTKIIPASGAYHTPYMASAREKLHSTLRSSRASMKPPRCDVYMNSSGEVIRAGTNPEKIIPLLCDVLTSSVLWESCVKGMIAAGIQEFYEVGPLNQLKSMMKRIHKDSWDRTESIEV